MNKIGLILVLFLCEASFSQEVTHFIIQGNKKTKEHFIKKISDVFVGFTLDSTVINKDIKRIKRLPGISQAYYQVKKNNDNTYTIIYILEENITLIPSANFFTTNDGEYAFKLGLNEFNSFGQNISIGATFQRDIYNSISINFRAPYLFNKVLGLAFNYNNLTTLEPIFFNETNANYKYNNNSFEILGIYELNFNHNFELGFNYFTETYEYKDGATNPSIPQNLKERKILFKLIYQYDNINYFYQYISGFKSTFNFQLVTRTDGNTPGFVIGWNDFNYYKRIGEKGNWANRFRVGVSSNNDSPFAPFAVDNNLNVRGVGNVIDRGTAVLLLNTEYRHILFEKGWFSLQGNAFVDTGTWRKPGGDFSDFGDKDNLRVYPGVGIRFIHKRIFNAVFRIDYGYGITKNATRGFVFGIGQYF